MIHPDEMWDDPISEVDPDEPAPVLTTDIFRSTPKESFEDRMERDFKALEGEFARTHFTPDYEEATAA